MTAQHRRRRTAAAALAAATVLALSACGEDSAEEQVAVPEGSEDLLEEDQVLEDEGLLDEDTVEDEPGIPFEDIPGDELVDPSFEGAYDEAFLEDVQTLVGQDVLLTGEVADVLSPQVFVITPPDDTAIEPLIVVSADPPPDLEPGVRVRVGGALEEGFDLTDIESDLDVDLNDPAFEDYPGAPFLLADVVQVAPAAGGTPTPTG